MSLQTRTDAKVNNSTRSTERYGRRSRQASTVRRPGSTGGRRVPTRWQRTQRARRAIISVVTVLAAWELAIRVFDPNSLIVVGPSSIAEAFTELAQNGNLWTHIQVSLRQFGQGFGLAIALAVPLGLMMGSSKVVNDYADPWLTALYATPNIALAPLLITWLGLGDPAHVAIIALVAFFPIIINTIAGVHNVDSELRDVGVAFHANRREVFARIDLPGSFPYIFTGLRLGVARALVGVVVADLFGSTAGLGYLILNSAQVFRTADVFVGVVTLAVLGVVMTALLRLVERFLTPWETRRRA